MSDLFGDYKRPNAEKKLIEKFIKIFEKSKALFKNKKYLEAIDGFKNSYQLLLDIWDHFPKITTLYYMMKGYFYARQYSKCKTIIDSLDPLLVYIPKDKNEFFIKIKSKIFFYELILYFINDDIDNSTDSIIGLIKYLCNHPTFDLIEKSKFFWNYIKSFIKIVGISNSNKFHLLEEGYSSMIVEQVIIRNNDENKNNQNEENIKVPKVNRYMVETYKNFMNSKLRGIMYELLDKEFYYVKYGKVDDKVMVFLHKNINIFVRDNNKERFMELFHTFVVLNKTNLKKEYNMTLDELVFEQKRRIEAFDRIFSNLVGAFNHIFKKYYAEELPNITKKMRKNSMMKNFKININELKNLIKIRIQSPEKEDEPIDRKIKNKSKKLLFKNIINKVKDKPKNRGENDFTSLNFIKDIKIPPNNEEMDKQILIDNFITKRNVLKKNNLILKLKLDQKLSTKNYNQTLQNDFSLKLPTIIDRNNLKTERNETFNSHNYKDLTHRLNNIKTLNKKKTENSLENNSHVMEKKNINFKLRNINNYLITKILDNFLAIYNTEHGIPLEKSLDLSLIYPRKKDIFDFNIRNSIHSYSSISVNGSKQENQDDYFYYNNYFLIKNLTLFGVCDGHGQNGKEISNLISILFPSYLFYILLDDNLIERKLDINNKILKLMKIQEAPDEIKNMFIFRYFFNKFEIDFSYIPIISGKQNILFNQIHEALYYSHNELKNRYNIEIENSGTTLCSGLIYGNNLYIINVGDSRAVLGTYFINSNRWKSTQLSIDHKPTNPKENKRIISYNGRVERLKNEFGEEYGIYRVVGKENDSTYPGLAMSRSIGDENAKKFGVVYEPDIFKYELKERDKLLIIGSDGLWEHLSNEEVINIVGNCYNNAIKSEEAVNILIEKIKQKIINENENKNKNKRDSNKISSANNNKDKKVRNVKKEEIKMNFDNITCIVIYLNVK